MNAPQNVQTSNFNYPPNYSNPIMGQQQQQQQQQPNLAHQQYMYPKNPTQSHYMQQNTIPGGFQQHQGPQTGGPTSFFQSHNSSASASMNSGLSTDYSENDREFEKIIEHIANLKYPEKREEALGELSKKRESFSQLAVYLWHSVGTLAIL